MSRHCTIPKIFGLRKWYEKHFSDLCKEHDSAYIIRYGTRRDADLKFMAGMVKKGFPFTAFFSYIVIRAIGWAWWNFDD